MGGLRQKREAGLGARCDSNALGGDEERRRDSFGLGLDARARGDLLVLDDGERALDRERLLDDARRYSPISSVFHLNKIRQTVLLRLITFPLVWILVAVYASLAVRRPVSTLGPSAYYASSARRPL